MAYAHKNSKGQTYYLHTKDVTLRGGMHLKIYFFAKTVKPGSLDALPAGYLVIESKKTGLPLLKKDKKGK